MARVSAVVPSASSPRRHTAMHHAATWASLTPPSSHAPTNASMLAGSTSSPRRLRSRSSSGAKDGAGTILSSNLARLLVTSGAMARARYLTLAAMLLASGVAVAAPAPTAPSPTTTTAPGGTTTGVTGPAAPPPTTAAPGTTSTIPTATAPGSTAPVAEAPSLSSLRLAKTVTAQQGHAQFLVGARTATP